MQATLAVRAIADQTSLHPNFDLRKFPFLPATAWAAGPVAFAPDPRRAVRCDGTVRRRDSTRSGDLRLPPLRPHEGYQHQRHSENELSVQSASSAPAVLSRMLTFAAAKTLRIARAFWLNCISCFASLPGAFFVQHFEET